MREKCPGYHKYGSLFRFLAIFLLNQYSISKPAIGGRGIQIPTRNIARPFAPKAHVLSITPLTIDNNGIIANPLYFVICNQEQIKAGKVGILKK